MRDYIEAYLRGLMTALALLAGAPPIVGLAFIGLWVHREWVDPNTGFHTPISGQWLWLVGFWLIGGWVMVCRQAESKWPLRDIIGAQEVLILGVIGFSAVVSVVPWPAFWAAVVVVMAIVLPGTFLGSYVQQIRTKRHERIAAQERTNGIR